MQLPFLSSEENEVTPLERWIARKVLAVDGEAPVSVRLWNGEEVGEPGDDPLATIEVRDRAVLFELIRNPDLVIGDAYAEGRIELEGDLPGTIEAFFRARMGVPSIAAALSRVASMIPSPGNTLGRSRRNVHHHYDVGNEFYAMWLDPNLVYTCAYFLDDETSLYDAQLAKMEHVCRKVRLQPGDHVVEAGCGWGSLALYMAEHYDVKVRAFNVSSEQIKYARNQAKKKGLSQRVEFVEDDYRNISGRYDAFVSVGMLEHVGKAHYATLGRVIDGSLDTHGRGLLHSIGRSRPAQMNAWMERRIFPGAHIPSLREMLEVCESANLQVNDVENLRMHYARTLENWLSAYEEHADEIEDMYDSVFMRTYRLYLASSIAAFRTANTHLYQVAFTRCENNELPWTRQHLYARPTKPAPKKKRNGRRKQSGKKKSSRKRKKKS